MRLITLHGTSLNRTGTWHAVAQTFYIAVLIGWLSTQPPAIPLETLVSYFHFQNWHILAGVIVAVTLVAWQALVYRRIADRIFPGAFENEIGIIRHERKSIPVAIQLFENITVGILEEFIYRAMLIPMCGVVISVLLFVVPHLARSIKGQIVVSGNVLVCGIVLSILFIATGSLWPGIVAHVLHNIIVDLLVRKGYV